MTPEEVFALTSEDLARIQIFRDADVQDRHWLATAFHNSILASYAEGEMDLRRAVEIARSCALICERNYRVLLLANFVEQVVRITPKERDRRRGEHRHRNQAWVRRMAVIRIEVLRQRHPDEPWTPNEMNDWKSPMLELVIQEMMALGMLTERITARTLYGWHVDYAKAARV